MEPETRAYWPCRFEIRQEGRRPTLTGMFPFDSPATISDRGRVRKEQFKAGSFSFSIREARAGRRAIDLLVGHDYGKPVASTGADSLRLRETAAGVLLEADLPPESEQPSWIVDLVQSVRFGLMRGISPGFNIPPANVVAGAEELIPEPGGDGVMIRNILQAVVHEMSVVTRAAYKDSSVDLRAMQVPVADPFEETSNQFDPERAYRWL